MEELMVESISKDERIGMERREMSFSFNFSFYPSLMRIEKFRANPPSFNIQRQKF